MFFSAFSRVPTMAEASPAPTPSSSDSAALEAALALLIEQDVLDGATPVTADTDLFAAGLDSMAIMQLLLLIEEHHGVMLTAADLTRENFGSVRRLADLVTRRLQEKHAAPDTAPHGQR